MNTTLSDLLIVEDNPFIGSKIADAIGNLSMLKEIHLTETLQQAYDLLEKTNFKIVVLDLNLPDGNGIELLKYIKEKYSNTKFFVFSTKTEYKNICLKYGAFSFFDKANDFDNLIDVIKQEK